MSGFTDTNGNFHDPNLPAMVLAMFLEFFLMNTSSCSLTRTKTLYGADWVTSSANRMFNSNVPGFVNKSLRTAIKGFFSRPNLSATVTEMFPAFFTAILIFRMNQYENYVWSGDFHIINHLHDFIEHWDFCKNVFQF